VLTVAPTLAGAPFPAGVSVAGAAGKCAPVAKTVVRDVPGAQRALQPQRAWVLTRGAGVVVGVVDTGVSAASPALAGAVLPGRDVAGHGRGDDDCRGHGTFVAGLLAARPTPGRGFVGIAPAARVLPIRAATDENQANSGALAAGIRAAVDGGANVVAIALGTAEDPPALRRAVAYAATHDVLIVAAADAGSMSDGPVYPAALPGVVSVASIGQDGTSSSVGGPATTPTLAAPGANLLSIAPRGKGNLVASGSGIGVAFVAGAAALVRAYRPRLTAAQVRHRLETTADHPSGGLPDRALGYGIIDPVAAVTTALPEESGERARRAPEQPLRITPPAPKDPRPVRYALVASFGVGGGAALGGLVIATVKRGRRRAWRPGDSDKNDS
jgi:type VII secretion-associated serine protease mycosin